MSFCNNDAITRHHQLLICELKEHHEGSCRSSKWKWDERPDGQISAIAWKDKDHPDWEARALAAEKALTAAKELAAQAPVIIETERVLRALPVLSAFIAPNGLVAQRRPDGLWWAAGGTRGTSDMEIIALCFTVTVIHLGEDPTSRNEKD